MSYTVLARRYRSQTFDEVIGQEHIAQTLKKAIDSGRIAHAYLFCGTRGTGKTSMARILAKSLNCDKAKGPTTTPCGKCESCLAIARGDDMDVIEIDAASNTGVDNVREVIENSQYRPARSRFKIYIIDEAHMLSKQAFNALLKTLEEPPEHVKFILATTEPEKILPTILSRCQRYDFRNIPTREIAAHLKSIAKAEKIKADEDALLLVAKAGAGSMRDSLSLLDRLLSVGEKELTIELIEQMLGMPRTQVIFDLAQAIGEGDARKVIDISNKLISGGLSSDTLVASLTDHLRNLLVLRACGPETDLVDVPGLSLDDLQRQADRFDAMVLSQDIAILEELRRNLRTSGAGRALLDATLVRLGLAEQFSTVEELLAGVDGRSTSSSPSRTAPSPALKKNVEPPIGSTVEPVSQADEGDDDLPRPGKVFEGPSLKELLKQPSAFRPTAPPASTAGSESNVESADPNDLGALMQRLRDAIHRDAPGIDGFLAQGRIVARGEDGRYILSYPHEFATAAQMLDRNGKKELIQRELSQLLGEAVGIRIEIEPPIESPEPPPATKPPRGDGTSVPLQSPAAPAPPGTPSIRLTPELKEQLRADPLIASVIDELGGEIVKVE
jgi:DNA polymerase-3 subunit gamma/tau